MIELIAMRELAKALKLDRNAIYEMIKKNKFPQPLKISPRKFRWIASDVEKWVFNFKK